MTKVTKKHLDTVYREKELTRRIEQKFNELYGQYNTMLVGDESKDDETFKNINTEWKLYCYKMSRLQKLIRVNPFAFQSKIKGSKPVVINSEQVTPDPCDFDDHIRL